MPVAKRRTVEQKKLKGGCCSDEHSHRLQVLTSAAKMARAGISYPCYCLQLTAVLGTVTKILALMPQLHTSIKRPLLSVSNRR